MLTWGLLILSFWLCTCFHHKIPCCMQKIKWAPALAHLLISHHLQRKTSSDLHRLQRTDQPMICHGHPNVPGENWSVKPETQASERKACSGRLVSSNWTNQVQHKLNLNDDDDDDDSGVVVVVVVMVVVMVMVVVVVIMMMMLYSIHSRLCRVLVILEEGFQLPLSWKCGAKT